MLDAWKRLSSLKLLPISQAAMDPARAAIDDVLAEALGGAVDPTRYFVKYGDNMWAAVKGYLEEVTAVAAAPVIEKYTGVLAAADVFTESTTFWVMESIRLDRGYGSQVHP